MGVLLILFFLWRLIGISIAYIADSFNKYHKHFPYKFELYRYNHSIPKFLINYANYDGAHYLYIAHNSYGGYEQAFFPLYPLLIHVLGSFLDIFLGGAFFLSGFLIANLSFLFGLYFFKKYLEAIGKSKGTSIWIILFLLLFPTSFFFGAVYTEGLFFLLVSLVLYLSQKKKIWCFILYICSRCFNKTNGIFSYYSTLYNVSY